MSDKNTWRDGQLKISHYKNMNNTICFVNSGSAFIQFIPFLFWQKKNTNKIPFLRPPLFHEHHFFPSFLLHTYHFFGKMIFHRQTMTKSVLTLSLIFIATASSAFTSSSSSCPDAIATKLQTCLDQVERDESVLPGGPCSSLDWRCEQ